MSPTAGTAQSRKSRLTEFAIRRPFALFTAYAMIGALALVALSWQHSKNIRESTALKAAEAYSEAVSSMRGYYSRHVVPSAQKAGATVTQNAVRSDTSIPFPATLTIELANQLRAEGNAFSFSFYSNNPFPGRRDRALDPFEKAALSAIMNGETKKFIRYETHNGQQSVRVGAPVIMGETCVSCHNTHPDSPRRDWKAGDIRGVQQITLPLPDVGASFIPDLRESAIYVGIFTLVGIALIWLLLRELQLRIEQTRALASATEAKNVELAAAKAEADQANKAQGELIANVGHELRTPLNCIIGFSEILMDERLGPMGNAQYRDFAGEIHSGGEQLLGIINSILFMSQLESGRAEMRQETISLGAFLQECIAGYAQAAAAKAITIHRACDDDLPNVMFDRRGFATICRALCSNAVKFGKPGGWVSVSAVRLEDGGVAVRFEDCGIGIPAEMLEEIRKPFRQADGGHARRHEGMGLGLTLANSIAKIHACTIDIRSVEDVGTTVTLQIPQSRTAVASASPSRAAAA